MTERPAPSRLLVRGKPEGSGERVRVAPGDGDMQRISFRVLDLAAGESTQGMTGMTETVLVVVSGSMHVASSDGSWENVGGRPDPFSGQPVAIYLPPGGSYEVTAASPLEVAICAAPSKEHRPARLIAPPASDEYARGDGHAQRRIRDILMKDDDASALFLTEVVTLPGNWSSYPPHKHDTDDLPRESELEELYYYRAAPSAGFAFQRIYTADRSLDETVTAHDGDVVLVPRGYHVCAAAAGYWIYYLNVLAGPKHVYRMSFDPDHEWVKANWSWSSVSS